MIGTTLAHLHREAREQRFVLLASIAILILGAAAGTAAVRLHQLSAEWLRSGICAVGALLFLTLIATDLLSGDTARGTKEFLRRAPRGLGSAWCGKLLFLTLCAPLLPCCAVLLADLGLRAVGVPTNPGLPLGIDSFVIATGILLTLWVFAAAAFVRRGILALPLALAFLAPWLALCVETIDLPREYRPFGTDIAHIVDPRVLFCGACLVAGGLGAATFLRGPRRGAMVLAPGLALLTLPLAVDYDRQMNPAPETLQLMPWCGGIDRDAQTVTMFASARGNRHLWRVSVDLTTGRTVEIDNADGLSALPPGVAMRMELPLDQSRQAEIGAHSVRIVSPDADVIEFGFPGDPPLVCGLGVQIRETASTGNRRSMRSICSTIDLGRARHFTAPLLARGGCWVLGQEWLIANRTMPGFRLADWTLFDPDTGASRAAAWMEDGDRVVTRLRDGRLVIAHAERGTAERTRLVDPNTGAAIRLALPESCSRVVPALRFGASALLGRDWLQTDARAVVSIDAGEDALRIDTRGGFDVLGASDDTHLLLMDGIRPMLTRMRARDGLSEAIVLH